MSRARRARRRVRQRARRKAMLALATASSALAAAQEPQVAPVVRATGGWQLLLLRLLAFALIVSGAAVTAYPLIASLVAETGQKRLEYEWVAEASRQPALQLDPGPESTYTYLEVLRPQDPPTPPVSSGWLSSQSVAQRRHRYACGLSTVQEVQQGLIRGASVKTEWWPARIRIPSIGLTMYACEGVGEDVLKYAPGHMPGTALPGCPGNCVITGHRFVRAPSFRSLEDVIRGAYVYITTPSGEVTYRITNRLRVDETETRYLRPTARPTLTLLTCSGLRSRKRLLVIGELCTMPILCFNQSHKGGSQ
jgi:LPXTG-site transpeptidase (sortase) family protein